MSENDVKTTVLSESENYSAWKAEEPDGETTFHLELNNVTLHFFEEEWKQLLEALKSDEIDEPSGEDGEPAFHLEFDNVIVYFTDEEWEEFQGLMEDIS